MYMHRHPGNEGGGVNSRGNVFCKIKCIFPSVCGNKNGKLLCVQRSS